MDSVPAIGTRYQFMLACVLFGIVEWWTEPIVHYIGFVGRDNVTLTSDFVAHWTNFGRDEFFGMIAASVFMVAVEYARRLFIYMKTPNFGLPMGSKEAHV